jgi:hypothetical protein
MGQETRQGKIPRASQFLEVLHPVMIILGHGTSQNGIQQGLIEDVCSGNRSFFSILCPRGIGPGKKLIDTSFITL